MNKKIVTLICSCSLFLSLFPFTLVTAETITETTATETTLPSMSDDILELPQTKTEELTPSSTTEEEPEKQPVTEKKSVDEPDKTTIESQQKKVQEIVEKPEVEESVAEKASPDISTFASTDKLKEGVDINSQFAAILRSTDDSIRASISTVSGQNPWSGTGKGKDQLTKGDMEDLKSVIILDRGANLKGELKGIEFAVNLENLSITGNEVTKLDVSALSKLTGLYVNKNQLASLDVSALKKLKSLNVSNNPFITTLNVSSLPELSLLYIDFLTGLKSLTLTDLPKLTSYRDFGDPNVSGSGHPIIEKVTIKNIGAAQISISGNKPNLKEIEISNNKALTRLMVDRNPLLTDLTISGNPLLLNSGFYYTHNPSLVNFTVTNNAGLTSLNCSTNYPNLKTLTVTGNAGLQTLYCQNNGSITSLSITASPALKILDCSNNKLSGIGGAYDAASLEKLDCSNNVLTGLNTSNLKKLIELNCSNNQLSSINLTPLLALKDLNCSTNRLASLDISASSALEILNCSNNNLTALNLTSNAALIELNCSVNKIANFAGAYSMVNLQKFNCSNNSLVGLNTSNLKKLVELDCSNNQLPAFNMTTLPELVTLNASNNLLKAITVNANDNPKLENLNCSKNFISDITSTNGLTSLTILDATSQTLTTNIPAIVNGKATLTRTITTLGSNLNVYEPISWGIGFVSPGSLSTGNGSAHNQILFDGVTKKSFFDGTTKGIGFNYTNLQEGASSGYKRFSGVITFNDASELTHTLVPEKDQLIAGEVINWTWTIENTSDVDTTETLTKLTLPAGLAVEAGSVTNGSGGSLADGVLNSNHGVLAAGQSIVLKFKTRSTGTLGTLNTTGEIQWKDSGSGADYHAKTITKPVTVISPGSLELLSAPAGFNYGVRHLSLLGSPLHLRGAEYQGATNDFYIRVNDTRIVSTGWSLTAQLGELKDSQHNDSLVNAYLTFSNMSLLAVDNPNTPGESASASQANPPTILDQNPVLQANGNPKTLLSAATNKGKNAWRLTLPFNKVALTVPENNVGTGYSYQGTLTWSLNDTPA